jgi:saccharopepsin
MSLEGTWKGTNGSIITLGVSGPNILIGTYQPSIKSTRAYMTIAYQTTSTSAPDAGQAVSLAIQWHAIRGALDTSAHWVSGLSGQLVNHGDTQRLILMHAIVASTDFPGLATAGTYIDRLIYTRVSTEAPEPSAQRTPGNAVTPNPLEGRWFAHDGTTLLIHPIVPHSGGAPGQISGKLNSNGSVSIFQGVTDQNASTAGLGLQSTAIIALLNESTGPAIALAGTLEIDYKLLTLLELESSPAGAVNTRLRTAVSSKVFLKV